MFSLSIFQFRLRICDSVSPKPQNRRVAVTLSIIRKGVPRRDGIRKRASEGVEGNSRPVTRTRAFPSRSNQKKAVERV